MPRRGNKVVKRAVAPDAKYSSTTAAEFINKIMLRGQKATAERIVYDALEHVSQRLSTGPVDALEQAVKNATPVVMVRSRRVGGATYQVPVEVPGDHGRSTAMKWLVTSARARSGKSIVEKLTAELIDAIQGRGAAIKKRDDIHRMAEANKAFVHFRW